MGSFAGAEFIKCKQWVAEKIQNGYSWEDVAHLCVSINEEAEFDRLQNEELIIPPNMVFCEWREFVDTIRQNYIPIVDLYGISDGKANILSVPTDSGSAWMKYKEHLLGRKTGKPKMSETAADMVENNCHWILNHLNRDTRSTGPVKGLVMGSVQSGKTANMIGLVTMAAHYDWNVFIVLSGSIDNLRKQTRDRFFRDLKQSGGLSWVVLDYTNNANYMVDIQTHEKYMTDDLKLNVYQSGRTTNQWMYRYVFVCLKNSKRLKNLIAWLHSNNAKAARMRILIIDDEAYQASINTVKMGTPQDEDEIERTAVNQLIINLIKGNNAEGSPSSAVFQAVNYTSFTATPYANVLNEAYKDSLYPSNFICSLPESLEYFGPKAIWGSKQDENYSGLNIVREIPFSEINELKKVHNGQTSVLPLEFRNAIAWFLCSASILRRRGHKKPISMLIHTTSIQNGHFEEYELMKDWLSTGNRKREILDLCEQVYSEEKDEFRFSDLKEGFPKYSKLNEVCDVFPAFSELRDDIEMMLKEVVNIGLGEEKELSYHENGIHLCVDNCRANKYADEGSFLRVVYPTEEKLARMNKAPVFIVLGGNTLSRGLTIEGLVCTYFARNVNQADTLMQMARWFGYRSGYELLQRIWMTNPVQEKFELIEEIDEKLKREFEDFMRKGKSPSLFGPKIMSSSKIARFLLTSKTKSQNMIPCDVDFSGDSYEVTQYENDDSELKKNIEVAERFLSGLSGAKKSNAIDSSYFWKGVDSAIVLSEFLNKYTIFNCSPLHVDIPIFIDWMKQMNSDCRYLKWDVAIAGDKESISRWRISGADVGKIERSKKRKQKNYIDIGSLRSGRDILSDICVSELSPEQKKLFDEGKKSGKNLVGLRYKLGMEDVPLLLLYRIDKDKGKESKYRTGIQTKHDIIGFSIVISGQETGSDYVKTVSVRIPE